MKRLRGWIAARLWRRLMFGQLLVLVLAMLVLQCLAAFIVAAYVTDTSPIEGDAGWLARAYARPVGWIIESGEPGDLVRLLDMVALGSVVLPEPVEEISVPRVNFSNDGDPLERLVAVTVLDRGGTVLTVTGEPRAQMEHDAAWDELVGLALNGETNPYTLSRWLDRDDGDLLLGTAPVSGSNKEMVGVVAVEMLPALPLETSGALAPAAGFLLVAFVSSLLGLPVLSLAVVLTAISGVVVGRSLGKRLKGLETTAQTMAGGNLTLRVEDTSPDEIGQVGQAFNQMAEQLGESLEAQAREKEQVEALLRARRDLIANISHDLRTPIASLSAHLETLSAYPDRLDEYLPILNDESARTADLITDLFELARLDAHELVLDLMPTTVTEVINKVAASYRALAWEQRRIVLDVDLPAQLPPVLADAQRVEQVLTNLITNGLRFTHEGGVITVLAAMLGNAVEISVSDTGIGIPAEDLPYIFDRFYRTDRARSRPDTEGRLGGGSGLGLPIVKGLVEEMGGAVRASSTRGEGTCISFTLPMIID